MPTLRDGPFRQGRASPTLPLIAGRDHEEGDAQQRMRHYNISRTRIDGSLAKKGRPSTRTSPSDGAMGMRRRGTRWSGSADPMRSRWSWTERKHIPVDGAVALQAERSFGNYHSDSHSPLAAPACSFRRFMLEYVAILVSVALLVLGTSAAVVTVHGGFAGSLLQEHLAFDTDGR